MIILVVCIPISQNLENKWKMREKRDFFYFTLFPKTMAKKFQRLFTLTAFEP